MFGLFSGLLLDRSDLEGVACSLIKDDGCSLFRMKTLFRSFEGVCGSFGLMEWLAVFSFRFSFWDLLTCVELELFDGRRNCILTFFQCK